MVRSTEGSWRITILPSAVARTSNSTIPQPRETASAKAGIVFSGKLLEAPRWAQTMTGLLMLMMSLLDYLLTP